MDKVRVFRVLMYEGDRAAVEKQIELSLHGRRKGLSSGSVGECSITAVTLGEFPELLKGDSNAEGE